MSDTEETTSCHSEIHAVQTDVRRIENRFTLLLSLLQSEWTGRESYAIAAAIFSEDAGETDAVLIEDITSCRHTAQALFRQIKEGAVTPCTLADVLEDLL